MEGLWHCPVPPDKQQMTQTGRRGAPARALAVAVALLAVLACLPLAAAKSTHAQLRRDDRSLVLLAEPFGFSEAGTINLTVSGFTLWTPGHVKKTGPFNRCALEAGQGRWGHASGCRRRSAVHSVATTAGVLAQFQPAYSACVQAQHTQPGAARN